MVPLFLLRFTCQGWHMLYRKNSEFHAVICHRPVPQFPCSSEQNQQSGWNNRTRTVILCMLEVITRQALLVYLFGAHNHSDTPLPESSACHWGAISFTPSVASQLLIKLTHNFLTLKTSWGLIWFPNSLHTTFAVIFLLHYTWVEYPRSCRSYQGKTGQKIFYLHVFHEACYKCIKKYTPPVIDSCQLSWMWPFTTSRKRSGCNREYAQVFFYIVYPPLPVPDSHIWQVHLALVIA